MQPLTNNQKGIVYACVTALFWGFLAIALKVSLKDLDSVTIVWFRFAFAFVTLFVYFLFSDPGQLAIFKRPPGLLLVAAGGLGLNYLGYMQGINYTTPSNAQIIIQTGPILLGIAGVVFFKEKITGKQALGFGIAALGMFFFYRNQLSQFIHDPSAFNKGFLWIEMAAFSWAAYAVLQKKLVQKHPAQTLNMVLYGVPALFYLPMVDFGAFVDLSLGSWLLVIFLGLNTLIAYGCIALAFKYTQAYKVSIIITMNPIITFITMFILGSMNVTWIATENFSVLSFVGAAMVLGGAIVAIFFSRKKKIITEKASSPVHKDHKGKIDKTVF